MVTTGADVARQRGPPVAGVHELAYTLLRDQTRVVSAGVATRIGMLVPLGIRGGLRSTLGYLVRSVDSDESLAPSISMRRRAIIAVGRPP